MDRSGNGNGGLPTLAQDEFSALIRSVIVDLPELLGVEVPRDHVAVDRMHVVAAGLDPVAVTGWLEPQGGFAGVAYLRAVGHRSAEGPCRPALHPVAYFSIPLRALQPGLPADASANPPAGSPS